MKDWRTFVVLGLVALLGGAGVFFWQSHAEAENWKLRALRAEEESARRAAEQTAREKSAREAQDQADARKLDPAEMAGAPTAKPAAAARDSAGKGGLEDAIHVDIVKQWLAEANDPAVLRRLNTQARNQTLRRFAALFTQMNLPPEQTEALTKLLADKRQAPMDIAVGSLQQGTDPTDDMDKYRGQIIASRAEIENQIYAVLGDAGYAQYQDYDQNFAHANMLTNLQVALQNTAEPLTAEQVSRLNDVMHATNATHVTDPVIDGAKDFLSAGQLQALKDLRAIQLANSQKRLQPAQILPTGETTGSGKP